MMISNVALHHTWPPISGNKLPVGIRYFYKYNNELAWEIVATAKYTTTIEEEEEKKVYL